MRQILTTPDSLTNDLLILISLVIGERTELQQLQEVYQILDTEPYLNQKRGQTRHSRGPVHESSVSCVTPSERNLSLR